MHTPCSNQITCQGHALVCLQKETQAVCCMRHSRIHMPASTCPELDWAIMHAVLQMPILTASDRNVSARYNKFLSLLCDLQRWVSQLAARDCLVQPESFRQQMHFFWLARTVPPVWSNQLSSRSRRAADYIGAGQGADWQTRNMKKVRFC